MECVLTIPDEIAADLQQVNGGGVARRLLEMAVLEGYKSGEFSAYQVQQILGFESRVEVDGFLKQHGVVEEITLEEFAQQKQSLKNLLAK
jgi:hypothetical protein